MSTNASTNFPMHNGPLLAVAGVMFNESSEVLLIQRANEPGRGLWTLPGGKVAVGEKLHQALVREFKEEVGLDIIVEKLIAPFEICKAALHYVVLDYLVQMRGGTLKAGDDAARAKWCSWQDIESLPTTNGLLAMLILAKELR